MKKLLIILCLAVGVMAAGGCGGANKDEKKAAPPSGSTAQSITIGLMPDVDSIPFIIAQEKGYFAEEGLTVTLKSFKSAMDRDSALQSGNLDGEISDMLAEGFAKAGGFDTVITSLTNGSYKLVIGKDQALANLDGLKGKNVAISKNTVIEYVTDQIMSEGGMSSNDINKVVIPQIPARLEMLQSGKIAAATLPEPMASLAVKGGGRIVNSSDKLGINPGVLIFSRKAVTEKEKEIAAMYRAYNKAIDYLAKEPAENYIDLVIAKGGFPESVKGALVLPQYKKPTLPDTKDVDSVMKWLQARQLIPKAYTYQEVVDGRFVGK